MLTANIKKALASYDAVEVGVFCNYLEELAAETKDGKKKNWWLESKVTDSQLVAAYKKVNIDAPLFIDGETITVSFQYGKLKVIYDYHAYKNKLLSIYPESIVDFGIVYKADAFSFSKASGKVVYKHEINDPFKTDKEIVGAYGVIKNRRGEFLELLTMEDIKKMRAVAQTDTVWKAWFDRMVLKSTIKRSCRSHFFDAFKNIEELDNENYNLEQVGQIDKEDVYKKIATFKSVAKLIEWASHEDRKEYHNDQAFRSAVGAKKASLEEGKEGKNVKDS